MSKIKLSDYVARRLKEKYGVEHFFLVSGGGAMHLNDSLGREIPYIANHHEQACAIAAEGYSRKGEKLAVVNVTTGPGGLNCLNGVFGQWTDSASVLYISGQVKKRTTMKFANIPGLRQLGDQEVDIISTVKHLTKYAVTVENPDEIKYHLDRAIFEATSGRLGPVWLDIPMDVQSALIDEQNLKEFIGEKHQVDEKILKEKVEKAILYLKNAKRPLIVAGHGIRIAKQVEIFNSIVEKLHIPIVTTFNGFDIIEDDNPYYVGRIGTIGQRAGNFALQNADCILFLGTRNNVRQSSYNFENFAKNAFKIVVDIDKSELEKPLVVPDLPICADLKDFFVFFKENICDLKNSYWIDFCKTLKNKYCFENTKEYISENDEIKAYDFAHKLSLALEENDTLIMANGSACVCSFQVAKVKKNQRFILNSGNASMGWALPSAIGASLCNKKGNVVCLEGDGSIMMNIQELQTIKHNNLPIKIFVINNCGYSSIRQTQKNFFQGHMTASGVDSGVSVPDFVEIGKAFGIKSFRISNSKNLKEQIKSVISSNEPVLCEVIVEQEYSFSPKLSAKKLTDGTIVSPSLEDMFPFLERKEFEKNLIK